MECITTLADFARATKQLVRGAIKSKLFVGEDGAFNMHVAKVENITQDGQCLKNVVQLKVAKGPFVAVLEATVSTRVFNKIAPEFFDKNLAQFKSIKGITSVNAIFPEFVE